MDFMAGASDNQNAADAPRLEVPPLRSLRGARAISDIPLEADVIRAVGQLLAVHPMVLYALRMNSGAASYEAKTGKFAPVWFHIWVRAPEKCRMADFYGATKDSRIIALECKRENWTHPTDLREREQAAFLALVRGVGGIGGFVRTADEAKALLDA